MNTEQILRIKYSKLLGNYIGNLSGIIEWEIPAELKEKIEDKLKELRKPDAETAMNDTIKCDNCDNGVVEWIQKCCACGKEY